MSMNGSTRTPRETRLRGILRKVLRENAVDGPQNQGLHGWRCQYPDRYGPCKCFESLVDDLTAALMKEEES